jgi:radical SAM protein with 4Fe4S-binding SPASM domain
LESAERAFASVRTPAEKWDPPKPGQLERAWLFSCNNVTRNPKHPTAEQLICKGHCAYYKPGPQKEEVCKGFAVLEELIKRRPQIATHFPPKGRGVLKGRYATLLDRTLCRTCDFFVDGCDFTDPAYTRPALPCGGYLAAELLMERADEAADTLLRTLVSEKTKAVLSPRCFLKHLETPCLYHTERDELFELDEAGFAFLKQCDGKHPLSDLPLDKDFLEFCFKEELLVIGPAVDERSFRVRPSPIPSLRYLELQLTRQCNLKCRHCYLGDPQKVDLPLPDVLFVLGEFEEMQGLRVLFSGGEPLLYPQLQGLNDALPGFGIRKVLLTNGTLITEDHYPKWRHFDEIQFSVDGLKEGHEAIRGRGTYGQTIKGIETAQKKGMAVSIATMVHRYNLNELDGMAAWVKEQGFTEWNIDVPCETGRLSHNREFLVSPTQGAPYLAYAAGGSYHGGGDEPFACGYHLCTVTPEGKILKCGFFEEPLGTLKDGLEASWRRLRPVPLSDLECGSCPHLPVCKGGCRFRAAGPLGKDPVMCALYGREEP